MMPAIIDWIPLNYIHTPAVPFAYMVHFLYITAKSMLL